MDINKLFEEFYQEYRIGQKQKGAKSGFIDYFVARTFLLNAINKNTIHIVSKLKELIKEKGHQQEDNTVWIDMDELLDIIENGKPCECPKGGFYSDGTICEKCLGTEFIKFYQ